MKTFTTLFISFISLSSFIQPPGSPSNMPGSDTSTVEMDGGKINPEKQRSDTAKAIPKGPKKIKNKQKKEAGK